MKTKLLAILNLFFSFNVYAQQKDGLHNKNFTQIGQILLAKDLYGIYSFLSDSNRFLYNYGESDSLKRIRLLYPFISRLGKNDLSQEREDIRNSANLFTGDFGLLKDINSDTDADIYHYNLNDFINSKFPTLNNIAYFQADDGIHGSELWRSDGTSAGTFLAKDLMPGVASSTPTMIVSAFGKLFFKAGPTDQLWISDGTDAGTKALTSFADNQFIKIDNIYGNENVLYFVCSANGYFLNQLWKSDGTASGTKIVFDLHSNGLGTGIKYLTEVNKILYFTASTPAAGYEVWRSDGTAAGTYLLKDINPSLYSDNEPEKLTSYNNKLYFTAYDGVERKIWMSDSMGTTAFSVSNPNNVLATRDYYYSMANIPFTISRNILYFYGFTPETGYELFRYDPVNGFRLVLDISAGASSTLMDSYASMEDVNGVLYFTAVDSAGNYSLWTSKGTTGSTSLVKQFSKSERLASLYNGYGTLFFSHYDSSYGYELWKSNGSLETTVLVKDINPGTGTSDPYLFTSLNKRVLFTAYIPKKGLELWRTDGTAEKTNQVKEINLTSTSSSTPGMYLNYYGSLPNGSIVFPAYERRLGVELYYSDGLSAGTRLLSDIAPGDRGSNPYQFKSMANEVYFKTISPNGNYGLHRTDGTKKGTQWIAETNSYLGEYAVTDNKLLFYIRYNNTKYNYELWRSDGSISGTFLLAGGLSIYSYPVAVGNNVFFNGTTVSNGSELWISDGTIANTKMVKDVVAGFGSSDPYSLFAYNGNIYFGAYNGFWKSDGSANGTIKLSEVAPIRLYSPQDMGKYFCISNNLLFMVGSTSAEGMELWRTDGTVTGTQIVKDILVGNANTSPFNLTDVNGVLYFEAGNGTGLYGLWKTNGTAAGTLLIQNMDNPFYDLCNAAGSLFFNLSGNLWISDGTTNGTTMISTAGMSGLTYVDRIKSSGTNLFFNGTSNLYGVELYGGNAAGNLRFIASKISGNLINVLEQLKVDILPNPTHSSVVINLSGVSESVLISCRDISGRIVLQKKYANCSSIQLDISNIVSGMYFVTISNGKEEKTLKLLKI